MNMKITSKRSILSVLVGILVGVLIYSFLRPACWGPLVAVFVAAYLAKVSTPKEGAKIGTMVLLPIGIYWYSQLPALVIAKDTVGKLGNLFGVVLGLLFISGVGALYGLLLGKFFQLTKNHGILF
jgi:hypothetical protein